MPFKRHILRKTARKLAKTEGGEEEPTEEDLPELPVKPKEVEVSDLMKGFEEYEKEEQEMSEEDKSRIRSLREEYEKGLLKETAEAGAAEAVPKVVDFSRVTDSVTGTREAMPHVETKEFAEAAKELAKAAKEMAKATTAKKPDEDGRMKNIPLKAHKIPIQYVKTMRAEWQPPDFADVNAIYPLIKPFAMVNLKWNQDRNKLEYLLIEPHMTAEQKRTLKTLKELVVDLLDINLFEIKEAASIRTVLKEKMNKVINDYGIILTEYEYQKILYYMYRDFLGLERLEPIMHDPAIEDVSCDGVKVPLYIYHRKYGSVATNVQFEDDEELNKFVIRIAQRCGKHISVAEPLLDGALPDGSRVQATFSSHKDIAMHGSTFTIRKFTRDPLTITDLLHFGTLPAMMAAYIWMAMEYRKSILVAGSTATGKTSLLNALSMFLPEENKIVSIEDTPEVRLPHEHWLQKVVRTGFGREDITGKKQGEISMYDLLRAALRERPDNLIVGEVRGKEAYVLFQGMATGHAGMATVHGDSVDAVLHRLQTPPINLPSGLLQHLNIIIILTKTRVKNIEVRRIKEVVEVLGLSKEHEPIINTLFRWHPADDTFEFASDKSYVLQNIIEDKGIEEKSIWEEIQRRTRILEWMSANDIRYYIDVGKILQQYYKNPEAVIKNI
ncbi:MAG: type II/IV secretion system ATPase subunit [Candidatus Diapherotrites archaeon]|nr:type II/IV secretion system ATPase subunit [Candidatus Diapherotrites archaeon]